MAPGVSIRRVGSGCGGVMHHSFLIYAAGFWLFLHGMLVKLVRLSEKKRDKDRKN